MAMNVELIILGVSFALVVVAFVGFVVSLVRAARPVTAPYLSPEAPGKPIAPGDFDASLEGLRVEVSPHAMSAVLHTPLRSSEWQPSESAVTAALPTIVDAHVAQQAPIQVPVSPVVQPPTPAPAQISVPDDFSAELAALLPDSETGANEPASEPDQSLDHLIRDLERDAAGVPTPVQESVAVPEEFVEVEQDAEDLSFDFTDELLASPAPVVTVPAPVVPTPPAPSPPPPTPVAAVALTPISRPESVPVAPIPVAPDEARPVAVPAAARPDTGRPVVRVAGVATDSQSVAEVVSEASPARTRDLPAGVVPDLVMAAPVEMWFGDARVGVKAGTATYDRFRKYADAMLHDLQENTSD